MSKTCKVSILGYGMMGTVRSVAYEAVTRYYPNCPIKPVLHGAYTYTDGEFAAANEVGWKASKDLDAVIKDPECEYVDVCLPNSMHYDAVMKSIEAGKHVFCEKPLAVSVDEARDMTTAIEKTNLLNSVNFIYRRCPSNVLARKLVKENRFGKLLEARSYYNQSWGGPDTPYSWRFSKTGGALGDLGSHALDMLYFVTGFRPIELVAMQCTHIKQRKVPSFVGSDLEARMKRSSGDAAEEAVWEKVDTDDATRIMYTLPGDAVGSLECTRNAWGTENTHGYELYFENGAIAWDYDDVNYLKIYDAATPERGWSRVLSNRGDIGAYASFADGHMFGYRDFTVNGCYENMLKIAGAEEVAPIASFRDAYDVERMIEAVRSSWENRAWVKLADFT